MKRVSQPPSNSAPLGFRKERLAPFVWWPVGTILIVTEQRPDNSFHGTSFDPAHFADLRDLLLRQAKTPHPIFSFEQGQLANVRTGNSVDALRLNGNGCCDPKSNCNQYQQDDKSDHYIRTTLLSSESAALRWLKKIVPSSLRTRLQVIPSADFHTLEWCVDGVDLLSLPIARK